MLSKTNKNQRKPADLLASLKITLLCFGSVETHHIIANQDIRSSHAIGKRQKKKEYTRESPPTFAAAKEEVVSKSLIHVCSIDSQRDGEFEKLFKSEKEECSKY